MNIHKTAKKMVVDHLAFQHTALFKQWAFAGAPSWQSRRISLGGRRRLGFTTAALKLAHEFAPSLIVVPRIQHIQHVSNTIEYTGIEVQDIVPIQRLEKHFYGKPDLRYTLAIIDEAFAAEQEVKADKMDELRCLLFDRADLLVEFQ